MRESFLLTDYRKYLKAQKISTSTVDNYLIDGEKFLNWLANYLTERGFTINLNQPGTFISYADRTAVVKYRRHLTSRRVAAATINRRISGLKKLLRFAVSSGYLAENPAATLKNVVLFDPKKTLSEFKKWLRKNDATDTTIKNYISDVRHFLNYCTNN